MSNRKYNRVNFRTQREQKVETDGFTVGSQVLIDGAHHGVVTEQGYPKSRVQLSDGSNLYYINDRIEAVNA